MTTESLARVSRIVIETFSRPPGERSRSISLTGGVEDVEPGPSAFARGETSAFAAPVGGASGWNEALTPKGAESCAPNGLVCAIGGAPNVVGSGGRPSAVLALDSVGAGGEAGLGARATKGGAEPSGFCPLRGASCAAARARLVRFDGGAPGRGAIGAGAAAVATAGTAFAKGFAGVASSPAKPAARTLSPLRSARGVRVEAPK